MDDLDYSVHISERDWDTFFQACEECDLQPPALAGLEDSGTSDANDGASSLSCVAEDGDSAKHDCPIDEPPECTGLPVERYLSACHHPGPEDMLSCSEEDRHLESINMFFERMKGIEGLGGGNFLAEAKPKETRHEVCDHVEPAKEPAVLTQLTRAKSQSDSLAPSLTAKEGKVDGAVSNGRGDKDRDRARDRAGKSVELESEEDDVFGPAEPTVELFIQEDGNVNEDRTQEKQVDFAKDELLQDAKSYSSPSSECRLSRENTVEDLQSLALKGKSGTEHRTGDEAMTTQAFLKEATSLYGHQVELQTDPEALLCVGMVTAAENHTVKSASGPKEHRIGSVVSQDSSRGQHSPSVRKKRKQIRSSGSDLAAGQAFEGLSGRTQSEKKQVEMFKQEAAGQGEVMFGHDSGVCVAEERSKLKSVSVHQMTRSPGRVPRSSELLSELHGVQESGADSHTTQHNHNFKESVTQLEECSKDNIPNFPDQQQCNPGHDFQNHSQQICIPASNTEIYNLTECEQHDNIPECLQLGAVIIQHDRTLPLCSGLSTPESRNGAEPFPLKVPERFNNLKPPDQILLKHEAALHMNSPEDDKAVCQLGDVSVKTSNSRESPQCNQPFVSTVSGLEDSRKENIPEHGHKVTAGQNLPAFSQEESKNVIRTPEISPHKQLIQMPNTVDLPEPTVVSLSSNSNGGHGTSWSSALDPVDVQCPESEEEESPPEYQEVEDDDEDDPNDDETQQCKNKTGTGNIATKTSCSASGDNKTSTVTTDKELLFQASELTDKQMPGQPDLVPTAAPASLDTYNAVISLSTNLTETAVVSDSNRSSTKPMVLPGSDSDKGSKTDDWLAVKGENLLQTSTNECVKNSQQASMDVSAANEVEAVFEPELQNDSSLDTPVLHSSEDRVHSRAECEPCLPAESTASAKPLEANEPSQPPETRQPIHSMSGFWKEMEKLTINDILYLRSGSSAPWDLPRDCALRNTSEAGGYSSRLEGSRPGRSSVDMSTIPNSEEKSSVSHSARAKSGLEPKDTKKTDQRSLGSSSSRGVLWESKFYSTGPGTDSDANETSKLYSGDSITPAFPSGKAQQSFRRMCKNISMQNLPALEGDPCVTQVSSASQVTAVTEEVELCESSSTIQRRKEDCSSVPPEGRSSVETSAASSRPRGEVTEGYGASFREIFRYFFGSGEAGVSQGDTSYTEVPAGDGGTVPEMYDHFFSEFEAGNFFFPLIQGKGGRQNESVPVTSCSSSFTRNLQFPEAYDYFFPDSSSSDSEDGEDSDDDQGPIRVVTRFDKGTGEPRDTAAAPDMYEHFFTSSDWRETLFWRHPFSLRRMRFMGVSGSREGPTSCVLVTAVQQGGPDFSTGCMDSAVDFHRAVSPQIPLYLEERIFRELEEQQRRYAALQTAIAVPNAPLLSLRQSDMCLICIAFASWVLKTASPHDADTWKAALLANISALSAIRYLRRYVRDAGKEP